MRISTKCSTAIHSLLAIAIFSPHSKVTSEMLAESVGCNPVEIRKIFAGLKKAGIISVSRGTGGTALLKEPKDISMLDIYLAVDKLALNEWIGVHSNPSDECFIGRNITALLAGPYNQVSEAVKATMAGISLESLLLNLYETEPALRELINAG